MAIFPLFKYKYHDFKFLLEMRMIEKFFSNFKKEDTLKLYLSKHFNAIKDRVHSWFQSLFTAL